MAANRRNYYTYGVMAASYGISAGRAASNQRYAKSTGARTQLQRARAISYAQPKGKGSKKKDYISNKGINFGGKKKLTKQQQARLNKQQRAAYTQRRKNVMYNRAGNAMFAAALAPYVAHYALGYRRLYSTNPATGQRMGKNTHIIGGLNRQGSYWTRHGKRANFAVRVPRFVAQGAPARGGNRGLKMIPSKTGGYRTSAYRGAKSFQRHVGSRGRMYGRRAAFHTQGARRATDRLRRNYKGQFAGWF